MKRYTVITHKSEGDLHLNEQDLLPASCRLITGIVVLATSKQAIGLSNSTKELSFPQHLITDIFQQKETTNLFYSYLRTRETEGESIAFFESDILPQFIQSLRNGIFFANIHSDYQNQVLDRLVRTLQGDITEHLYRENDLFNAGKQLNDLEFSEFIAKTILQFLYDRKSAIFYHPIQVYNQPKPYECGNISLLINGNNFLLRDFALMANRKLRSLQNEIFPLYEPLEVNSNIHTVFKNAKNNGNSSLTIKTVIEYESDK